MINQQLLDFIKKQTEQGTSKEIINKELLANDWTKEDIEEAYNAIKIPTPVPSPSNVPSPVSNSINNVSLPNSSVSNFSPSVNPLPTTSNVSDLNIQQQKKYAGFWVRLGAYFIDGLVLIIPVSAMIALSVFLIGIPKEITAESLTPIKNVATAINLLITWIYFIFMTYKYQGTLGKKAFGLKVFSVGLEKPTLGKVILRETIGRFISGAILLIGYMMAGWTEKKQSLHDKIASTVVVYNDPNKKTSSWPIVLIVLFVIGIPGILGFGSAVVIGTLGSAREKQNVKIKETLSLIIPEAISYSEKNSSYLGFVPVVAPVNCNSDPVVNISPDGRQIAVFMKSSCTDNALYFCVDPVTNFKEEIANADEEYVKSGKAVCYSEKDKEVDINIDNVNTDNNQVQNLDKNMQVDLANTFKDDVLGYQIKYPKDWKYERQEDKNTKATSINFIPDMKNPTMNFSITSIEVGDTGIPNPMALSLFTGLVQKDITNAGGKYNGTKDYIYKFSDGTILNGNEFESEYTQGNNKIKQWDIVILKGKKIFLTRFVFDAVGYDSLYETTKGMLGSWVIKK